MPQVDADRNLLFGVLALQLELIEDRQFTSACGEWATRKDTPLAQILLERGWITTDDRQQVDSLLERKLKKHGGNVHATLGGVADAQARDAIREVDDAEVRKSLSTLPPAAGYVLVKTLAPSPTEQRSRYTLTRMHAEGGLGKVWVAHDNDLNREVALKEIQPQQSAHPEMWRRFLKEAQVTGQLEHPNIVPVYELARRPQDDQPFYTMRFVRGRTLRQAIVEYHQHRAEGRVDPLELPRLLQAFVNVCQAIAYAHSRGVIHRDLKPENVVLGGFGEVLVLDWGLAKMVDQPDEESELRDIALTEDANAEATRAGSQLGTPAYMAPEQAEGRIDLIDGRTDIYGLGAILFNILTGRPPHEGQSIVELLDHIITGETPRVRVQEPSAPAALDAICGKAMAKARAERYAKASELAEDVQRWLADEPVRAYPEGPWARLSRWTRRHRAWVQAGAACVALVLLSAIGFAVQQTRLAERIRGEQTKTQNALQDVKSERDRTVAEKRKALDTLSDLCLERGRALDREGHAGEGLLWMARALELAPTDDLSRPYAIRANLSATAVDFSPLKAILEGSLIAFAPDGKSVLTGSDDNTARLWSAADGSFIGQPMVHQKALLCVGFAPDGKSVATGSLDGTARLWHAADGSPIGQPMKHPGPVRSLAFAPDGKSLLTVTYDSAMRLWSARDGSPMGQLKVQEDWPRYAAFAPDGKSVLTSGDSNTARLWSTTDGSPIGQPLAHHERITAIAFAPDGKSVLTGSADNTARLWNAADGSPIGQPLAHQGAVETVAFAPDGKSVVTGSRDNTARLWSATDGSLIGQPMIHQGGVRSVAFAPDGQSVLTGSNDYSARLWSASDGSPIGRPLIHQAEVGTVAFAPDGKSVLIGSGDDTSRLWTIAPNGSPAGQPTGHEEWHKSVAFAPDGKSVITGSQDKSDTSARLWSMTDGSPIGRPMVHQGTVAAVAFAPDGKSVLTGSYDNTARLWSAADGSPIGQPLVHDKAVWSVAFAPDGKSVLTGSYDRTARRWSIPDGSPIGQPLVHEMGVWLVAFAPDGKSFFTGSVDRPGRLWNALDGSPIGQPLADQGGVRSVAFAPDGKSVLTGGFNKTARLWSTADGSSIGRPMVHQGAVDAVAFAPDGNSVLTGSSDRTARLWSARDGSPIGQPMVHQGAVVSVAFAPDSKSLLTGSLDKTARLWSAADGSPIGQPLLHHGSLELAACAPDGKTLLTSSTTELKSRKIHRPIVGGARPVALWAQVVTGMELDPDHNSVRFLDRATWNERRRQLADLGKDAPGFP